MSRTNKQKQNHRAHHQEVTIQMRHRRHPEEVEQQLQVVQLHACNKYIKGKLPLQRWQT